MLSTLPVSRTNLSVSLSVQRIILYHNIIILFLFYYYSNIIYYYFCYNIIIIILSLLHVRGVEGWRRGRGCGSEVRGQHRYFWWRPIKRILPICSTRVVDHSNASPVIQQQVQTAHRHCAHSPTVHIVTIRLLPLIVSHPSLRRERETKGERDYVLRPTTIVTNQKNNYI